MAKTRKITKKGNTRKVAAQQKTVKKSQQIDRRNWKLGFFGFFGFLGLIAIPTKNYGLLGFFGFFGFFAFFGLCKK